MLERDVQRSRAMQVGMLMRAYRESFPTAEGGRGLTQEELLRRMASVDSDYGQRYSHTTVSRWESGATRPSRERLEVFARALNLSRAEIEGLISLAGFAAEIGQLPGEPDAEAEPQPVDQELISAVEPLEPVPQHPVPTPENRAFANVFPSLRLGFLSCLIPVVAIIGAGYLWSFLGWTALWIPIAYIGLVVGVRLAAGFQRLENDHDLCEFLCVSLFVLLTAPLLQTAMFNMDNYGFHSISDWADTAKPFMLALLVNLGLASIAGAMFYGLQKLRYGAGMRPGCSLRRAVSVVLPPIGLVYVVIAVLADAVVLVQLGVAFAFLAAVFVVMLLLRDPTVVPQEGDRRFLLWSLLVFGTVTTTVGGAAILAIYLVPDLPAEFPSYNLLYSWSLDFTELGVSPDEALGRFNVGYLWHATAIFVYMVFVVGAKLFASIYRWETSDTAGLGGRQSPPDSGDAPGGPPIRNRVGLFFSQGRPGARRTRTGPD